MKDIILQLIKESPNHAVVKIKNDTTLWQWVLENCDPNCVDDKTRIYTAYYGQLIHCPCKSGRLRTYVSFFKNLAFCGRANKCSAARQAVSAACKKSMTCIDKDAANSKREKTNIEKYGVTNIGQCEKTITSRKELYADLEKVSSITERIRETTLTRYGVSHVSLVPEIKNRMKATILERYGCEHASQNVNIKSKTRSTNIAKYGVEYPSQNIDIAKKLSATKKATMLEKYGRTHETQLHIAEENWDILQDKEKFSDMLLALGRLGMAKKLMVSPNLISVRHREHDLNILHQNMSSYEIEIKNWLTELGISYRKDNAICGGKELDFLMEDNKLAIEFDGLYWHSERTGKGSEYHYLKTQACSNNNIQLLHIFEDEWVNNKDICKSIIAGRLGKVGRIIYGRKCNIRTLSKQEARNFLKDNHLQGPGNSSYDIGLFFENELVNIMTFGKPRYNKNIEWELIRLATACNTVVVGGTNRLWSYFIKNINPVSVVSYCDKRWFSGDVYDKLGFEKTINGKPSYWYTDYYSRFHRSRFTKKNAIKGAIILGYSEEHLVDMTEKQITKNILNLDRIWDCGQDTWIWRK